MVRALQTPPALQNPSSNQNLPSSIVITYAIIMEIVLSEATARYQKLVRGVAGAMRVNR